MFILKKVLVTNLSIVTSVKNIFFSTWRIFCHMAYPFDLNINMWRIGISFVYVVYVAFTHPLHHQYLGFLFFFLCIYM